MASTVGVLVELIFIYVPVRVPHRYVSGRLVGSVGVGIRNAVSLFQIVNVVHW